jgi:hypothetical protein
MTHPSGLDVARTASRKRAGFSFDMTDGAVNFDG